MATETLPHPDLYTVSIGNTHTSVVGWESTGQPALAWTGKTSRRTLGGVAASVCKSICLVAGVVPKLRQEFVRELRSRKPPGVLIFRKDLPAPIEIIPDPPERVGDDRIAAALGALALEASCPWIVVDVGTAVTCNAVTPAAAGKLPRFEGGLIVPGAALCLKALAGGTAQLPDLRDALGDGGEFAFVGRNTDDAMRGGVLVSQVATVLAMIEGQRAALGAKTRVALTGGGAAGLQDALRLVPSPRLEFIFQPLLVHLGLFFAWKAAQHR